MNKRRLLALARLLDTVPPEKFGLAVWRCGTVACAVGHAAMNPWFKEQGLRLRRHIVTNEGRSCTGREFRGMTYDLRYKDRDGGVYDDIDAVEAFFDLEYGHARRLFMADGYDDDVLTQPKEVAARIRLFVKTGETV